MKKVIKRSLSIFITITIIFISAISGLGEVDLSGIFAVRADVASNFDLTFTLNEDGQSYSIVDCNKSISGDIVIPDVFNDLPVTEIGDFAFSNCNKLQSIIMGGRVTRIGDYAFNNCTSLKTVKLPDSEDYNKFKTTIINDCQNISDWTKNHPSNCEADTADFVLGTQSIRSVNGPMVCTQHTYDMLNNNLVLKLRINSIDNGARLYMQVLNNSAPSKSVVYELMRGASTTPVGEWREITVPYTGCAWGALNEIDFRSINYIKLYSSGGDVDWNLQYVGLKPIATDKGIITFTFDDGYKSQYTGLKILGEKGIKGTLFYVPEADTNGSGDYLKISDLQRLVEFYGADIEVHGASSYNDKTDAELISLWESTQQLLKENGLGEGRHMAYPNGMHEERVVNLAKNYFDSCRTIQYYIPSETYLPGDNYRIRAISSVGANGNNVEYIKDKIDRAMESNSWLVLVFHRIEDGNTTMYCSESELASIADYALSSGAEIKTMAEVMDSVSTIENSRGLNSIGEHAFYSCPRLKLISLPESVQQIGEKAFGYYYNEQNEADEKTKGFVVSGWKNSSAQFYAKDNGFDFKVICNHISSDWITDKYATCTTGGSQHKECTECGEILETKDLPAERHTTGHWIVDLQPTTNAPGQQHKECIYCGEVVETETIPLLKPATPKVAATNEINGVNITWNAVDGAVKYNVYRRQAGSNVWTLLGTTTGTAISDTKVTSGVFYCYSVTAYNSIGQSSSYASGNTKVIKYMAVPKLTGISNAMNGLFIKWNTVPGATNGYRVYRRGAGSTYWTYLATVKTPYYTDTQVKNRSGEYFRYTVIADGGYHSKFDVSGLYLMRLSAPALKSAVSSRAGITVKWGSVKGATYYNVYRKTVNSNWVYIGRTYGNTSTSYLDKTAKKGTTYTYTVRAAYGLTTSWFNSGISCYDKY